LFAVELVLASEVSCVVFLFAYVQSKHDLKGKDQLLVLVRKFPEGLAVVEVKDAYPNVLEDLQVTNSPHYIHEMFQTRDADAVRKVAQQTCC
jgi:hypothetical protein